jgi:large subunit ribosomal protein L10
VSSLCAGKTQRLIFYTREVNRLAISKEKKKELVAAYSEKFARSRAILGADYRGVTVAEISDLRNELRKQDCEFLVTKNTLAKLALKEADLPVPKSLLDGPTAMGVCYQDVAAPAKILADFAKEADSFSLKGGLLAKAEMSPEDIVMLSELPPREVMLSQLLGNMQAPVGGLARTLSGVVQGFANVMNARIDQLEKAEAA